MSIKRPRISLPRLPNTPRNPRGWGTTEIRVRGRGIPEIGSMRPSAPYGDPPGDFTGTLPEWAIFWGLERNGLEPGIDFSFEVNVGGTFISDVSVIDFLLPGHGIGIEILGEFWHYGQGTEKIHRDLLRASFFFERGIDVIFIDENDALEDPIYYAREAIAGRDHSKLATQSF